MTGTRIDVWLWAARFFKTWALAKRACELGRVQMHNHSIKPAHEVRIGDMMRVTTDSGEFEIEVLEVSEIRGPAPEAQKLYRETEESKARRKKAAEERRTMMMFEPAPVGRPNKRDRRRIVQFRGRG